MNGTAKNPVRFLLVDDLQENLLALDGVLRRSDLELLKARSAREALELLLQHDVALALIDIQMPELDGFELAELMRGMERTRRVPIIFVTAGSDDSRRRFRGYEAGAVDFIQKPIEPHVLRSKAEVFFELYRQRQEVERLLEESRRQSAALAEADKRKDEFLAMLAHELRNPLAPVRNAVEILRFPDVSGEDLAVIKDVIARQVTHMGRLIDDLLDVARISRGKMQLRFEPCDLARIVRQTAEDYRPIVNAAGLQLNVEVIDQPLAMHGDPTRLAQIIGNLLHNAAKFTPTGGEVSIRVANGSSDQDALVEVADNGAGMDKDVLTRLFEPFSQADQTLARTKGGLGLGLALTRGLAVLHGGIVTARSDGPGQGSTFSVKLPLSEAPATPPSIERPASPTAAGQLNVLIIEDNHDTARSLQMLLRHLGHRVDTAHEGLNGLTQTRANHPDVVISDLGLPGQWDGYAVAKAIRSDQSLEDICLIALSGYGQDEDRERSGQAGFEYHLVKPLDLDQLKAILANVSDRRGRRPVRL